VVLRVELFGGRPTASQLRRAVSNGRLKGFVEKLDSVEFAILEAGKTAPCVGQDFLESFFRGFIARPTDA
jgi:hypothetical protein